MTLKHAILVQVHVHVLYEKQLRSGGVTQEGINLVVLETQETFHVYQETINFLMWTWCGLIRWLMSVYRRRTTHWIHVVRWLMSVYRPRTTQWIHVGSWASEDNEWNGRFQYRIVNSHINVFLCFHSVVFSCFLEMTHTRTNTWSMFLEENQTTDSTNKFLQNPFGSHRHVICFTGKQITRYEL